MKLSHSVWLVGFTLSLGLACTGDVGPVGPTGPAGPTGEAGAPAASSGTIAGAVKDMSAAPIAGVAITTNPASVTATSDSQGQFSLANVPVGSYSVIANKTAYAPYTLPNVGVAANATTNVSLVLSVSNTAPGTISGTVTNSKDTNPDPIANATVAVEGQSVTTTTSGTGDFTLAGVTPGPVFLKVTPPDLTKYLPTDTRSAVLLNPNDTVTGVKLVVSARPSDAATYVGMSGACSVCHGPNNTNTGNMVAAVKSAAHNRSLGRISRASNGAANQGAWTMLLNPTLSSYRTVMIPLAGTIAVPAGSVVTGTGGFQSAATNCGATGTSACALQAGDVLGYTPKGLGWTAIGTIKSVDSDTQVTLSSAASFAPGVTSLAAGTAYSVARLSYGGYTHMWPEDANDIVAPAWPGVKATNPNYDPNDANIYNNTYTDGQVNVYLCNLKGRTLNTNGAASVTFTYDEYVMKFGGSPSTCNDGSFWDGTNTPSVPLVRIDVIYGGCGDKDASQTKKDNVGIFKQRFQGRMADAKVVSSWTPAYATQADRDRDSLTLPVQTLESGDKVNGGFKMNGYHPTEQKFPGESWTQRTRTFSHACAGCHNTGLAISWTMDATTQIHLQIPRDGTITTMDNAAITAFSYQDENITCEHCHGPASEHVNGGGGRANSIINPKFLTAEGERQVCGKCHAYDDAVNAKPAQTYGFEYPWNDDWKTNNLVGGGNYIAGIQDLKDAFDNFAEIPTDDEAFWDPAKTGGKMYGQAHRQQYTMLSYAVHTNNPYVKTTCVNCHDPHSTYLSTSKVQASNNDAYSFVTAGFKNNTLCLSCHAGGGPLSYMKTTDAFSLLSKDDIAALHISTGGTVIKNGSPMSAPSATDTATALDNIALAVANHMADKAKMSNATYNPTNDTLPTGRCASCHMPKLAKSGGYWTGVDYLGNKALIEGDQASHVFDIVWPSQSQALSRGGPSFQSGWYGQMYSASNTKYDLFGYMPNSCSKCHAGARQASVACPDTTAPWPSYWPLNDPVADPNMSYVTSKCFVSSLAP